MSSVLSLHADSGGLEKKSIAAFVTGSVTRDAVAKAMAIAGCPEPEIADGGIAAAIAAMAQQSAPSRLLVDYSDSNDSTAGVQALRGLCGSETRIILLGTVNDVRLYHALRDAGATDYLVKPVEPESLARALERIVPPVATGEGGTEGTRVIGVMGSRGGVGASTVAVNTAWHLAHHMNRRVALLDLDLQFGTVALSLDLEPCHGLREILQNAERVDSLIVSSALARESENLYVLAAQEPLAAPVKLDGMAVEHLMQELVRSHQVVVVDLPRDLAAGQPGLLKSFHKLAMVSELTLSAIRDTTRLAAFLRETAPATELVLVANKVGSGKPNELQTSEFRRGVQMSLDHTIPWDPKTACRAAKAGKPLAMVAERSAMVRGINSAGEALAGVSADGALPCGLAKWLKRN